MYRITYTTEDYYRRYDTDYHDCANETDVIQWISEFIVTYKNTGFIDDICIIQDVTSQFQPDPEIMRQIEQDIQDKKNAKEARAQELLREARKKEYEKLKQEFEES